MTYFTQVNGKFMEVRDIDEVCDNLKELFASQKRTNDILKTQNEKLLNEQYKDKELQRLKQENEKLKDRLTYSFEVTKKEWEAIHKWQEEHCSKNHGSNWSYEFLPTGIGTVGYCKCNSCGEKYEFAGLD